MFVLFSRGSMGKIVFECMELQILIMDSNMKREKRKKEQFQVIFELEQREQELMTIRMLCRQSLTFYSLTIDADYIKNHSDMYSFFPSPSDLLFTLIELFNDLQLSPEGTIILRLPLNAAKVKLTKVYQLKMQPWPEGELQYLRTRLTEQEQENARTILEKQEELRQLKEDMQKGQQIIIKMRQQQQQRKSEIAQLESRIIELEKELQSSRQEASYNQQLKLQALGQVQQLRADLKHQQQSHSSFQTEQKRIVSYQQRLFTCLFQANPHIYHFHYAYNSNGVRVIKKTENGWSNFVSGWPISQDGPSSFSFRMNRMRDGSLAIGVGTEAVMACSSLEHPEYIGYLCRDGRVYEGSNRKITGVPILHDQTATLTISQGLQGGSVSWHVGGVEIGTALLPYSLSQRRMFLIAKIFWKDDELELIF